MKILTNVLCQNIAGATQYLVDLLKYYNNYRSFNVYGVDIVHTLENRSWQQKLKFSNLKLIRRTLYYPNPHGLIKFKQLDIKVLYNQYKNTIDVYSKIVNNVKPDVILINGDNFLSWCLLQAARHYGQAKIYVHYHGILIKEISHWSEKEKAFVILMEKDFKDDNISYIFPSILAKKIVEKEIFCKQIVGKKNRSF